MPRQSRSDELITLFLSSRRRQIVFISRHRIHQTVMKNQTRHTRQHRRYRHQFRTGVAYASFATQARIGEYRPYLPIHRRNSEFNILEY